MRRLDKAALETEQRQKRRLAKRKPFSLTRNDPATDVSLRLLIISEGVNTEVSYFRQFEQPTIRVKAVGTGFNTVSLVRRAEQIRDEEAAKGRHYDQVWCVFDKDDFPAQDFNEAVRLAEQLFGPGRVAYSNQAFEYWLLLHFLDHQGGAMHRRQYDARLNECLNPFGVQYDGQASKLVSNEFFDLLLAIDPKTDKPRVRQAISRAERLDERYDHSNPAMEDSSTTVFRLVKVILG
ncbi:RloB family protein [Spirosoma rhododendri]|uniref:RloB domain-containing protein n=1 Tax=Spirosoma rhododendri TaxID=2728024 RepID=A0A7L5DT30_9BACT|nr:RloB family protein [Spirosoma rhododendri]QJD81624.1 RloB domain-containing protein [Spirosoma rhododendri]